MFPGKSMIQTADYLKGIIWNKNIVIDEIQLDFVKYESSKLLYSLYGASPQLLLLWLWFVRVSLYHGEQNRNLITTKSKTDH